MKRTARPSLPKWGEPPYFFHLEDWPNITEVGEVFDMEGGLAAVSVIDWSSMTFEVEDLVEWQGPAIDGSSLLIF